jgi:glycine dehydrogenase
VSVICDFVPCSVEAWVHSFFSTPVVNRKCQDRSMASRYVSRLSRSVRSPVNKRRTSIRTFASTKSGEGSIFDALDSFSPRHIGPDSHEASVMLQKLGYDSMESFVSATVPPHIRVSENSVSNETIASLSENELHMRAKELANKNKTFKSYIGMGYHNAVVPPVILRNVSRVS